MDLIESLADIRDKLKTRIYVACTGAGAGFQNHLWSLPGASSYLIGAAFPYAPEDTDEFLGFKPERYCSAETALDMAMGAYYRAYTPDGAPPIGIGLTASVASQKAHRGDHRVFAAWFSDQGHQVLGLTLPKREGEGPRLSDGKTADDLALIVLLHACNNSQSSRFQVECESAEERFFKRPYFRAVGTREGSPTPSKDLTLFPGAFNPPHEGHLGMADNFEREFGRKAAFAITYNPPHKEPLTVADMLKRAKLLRGRDRLFTKDDPLYIDKARAFPGASFLIGADAVERMYDAAWCEDPAVLSREFDSLGTWFYVAERKLADRYINIHTIICNPLYEGFPGQAIRGRWDISSSEIRALRNSLEKLDV